MRAHRSAAVDERLAQTLTQRRWLGPEELPPWVRASLEGGGISSQPTDLLAPHLRSGHLKRVLAPWITARLTLVAVVPSRKYMPSRTRAFIDYLIEHSRKTLEGLEIDPPGHESGSGLPNP